MLDYKLIIDYINLKLAFSIIIMKEASGGHSLALSNNNSTTLVAPQAIVSIRR